MRDVINQPPKIFKHLIYGMSVFVDRGLWEEWLLTNLRPVYRRWGNPEIMGVRRARA